MQGSLKGRSMRRPRLTWPLIAGLTLVAGLAGCLEAEPEGDEPEPEPWVPPEEVHLADAGEISGPFTRSWDFKVEDLNYTRIRALFIARAPETGSAGFLQGLQVSLTDATGGEPPYTARERGGQGGATAGIFTSTNQWVLAAGLLEERHLGTWTLEVSATGVAEWEMEVDVVYPDALAP